MFRLGPFELTECIGQGGMGEVWAASHPLATEPVAVKVLSAEALRDPVYRAAFRNEVRAVASLRHPHVIRVFEHGEVTEAEARHNDKLVTGMSYLAMELAGGGSLASRRGKLSWPEVRAALLALLDALAHAHARGVIHRDVKPGNVLLGKRQPSIKLTDFGLAHALDRNFPWEASTTAGTPAYMAPEQFVGEWRDFGPWTDLYALGCLGWALVSGHPPFRVTARIGAMKAHLSEDVPALKARSPIPDGFEAWLRRLLSKDLKHRYACAADAAWALLQLPTPARDTRQRVGDEPARWLPKALAQTTLVWPDRVVEGPLPQVPREWRRPLMIDPLRPQGTGLGLFGLQSFPMVDREWERDSLWSALERVHRDGQPVAVLLRGPPGCGKTRLAEWLARRAAELGVATALRSAHGPHAPGRAGLERLVARRFRAIGLRPEEMRYRVEAGLSAWGQPSREEVDELVELISDLGGDDSEERGPGSVRRRASVLRFLARLASERPIVLTFEDVQWGVEALEFVMDVLDRASRAPPLLMLLTWREDFAGMEESASLVEAIRRHERSVDLPVGPLDPVSGQELVEELLGVESELAAQVAERAEGNPLFAVQLITDWVDRGVLVSGPRGFRLEPHAEVALPDDLHQVWVERIHRLLGRRDSGDQVALELAAALGQEVDTTEWEEVCDEAGVEVSDDLIERLLDHRLAVRRMHERRWFFTHGMLRESLVRLAREAGRLQAHHRCCATVLQRRKGRYAAERLGRHLLDAGEAEQAIALLLDGAQRWVVEGDHSAADAVLVEIDRAIATAGIPGGDRRRVQAWVLRARVEVMRGQYKQAARWARIAGQVALQYDWPDLRSRALIYMGWAFHTLGHPDEADAFLSEARDLAEAVGDDELIAQALTFRAEVLRSRGEAAEAGAHFGRAVDLYGHRGAGAARSMLGLGSVALMVGDDEAARKHFEDARAAFEAAGGSRGLANAVTNLADLARHAGELDRAEALCREALRLYNRYDLGNAALANLNLALVLVAAGREEEADEYLDECMLSFQRQGWRGMVGIARAASLAGCARRRDWEGWQRNLDASAELLTSANLRDPDVAWLYELAAHAADEAGERARARKAWRLAAEHWMGLGRAAEAEAVLARVRAP